MLTALITLGLALASDTQSEAPEEDKLWLVFIGRGKSVEYLDKRPSELRFPMHHRSTIFLCDQASVLTLEKEINTPVHDEEESEEVRTESLRKWMATAKPGWFDDGYWQIAWIVALRRDAMSVKKPLKVRCADRSVAPHRLPFASAKDMLARQVISPEPAEGNGHGVIAWMLVPKDGEFPIMRCTMKGVMDAVHWWPNEPRHNEAPAYVDPSLKKDLYGWLKICRPGDAINNEFGKKWIIALAGGSQNTNNDDSYYECEDAV